MAGYVPATSVSLKIRSEKWKNGEILKDSRVYTKLAMRAE
jgi:hypothetical protein